MIDLKNLTIKKARKHLDDGDFTARELTEIYIKEIKKNNSDINAYLEVFDDVLAQADIADKIIKAGNSTALTGIPIAVKDNILIKGKIASAASKILSNYKATYDSTVIRKLKAEGAVFLGRTNMDEFAMGSSTENSAYGVTKNPCDTSRVAGGSSGGSAAAVAMNGALASLGSDTGGSIRQPASFCGVVGLKTTYGGVSRFGLMSMGSSLDQIGPIAKTVADAEIIFNEISGYDKFDSTSIPGTLRKSPKNTRKIVGIPYSFIEREGIDKEVLANFNLSIEKLKMQGYKIKNIELPHLKYSLAVYYIVMPAEVSTNLARFDGIRYGMREEEGTLIDSYKKTRGDGFGKETRRRVMLGTYVLSSGYYDSYYNKANSVRALLEKDFRDIFKEVDAIATPTTPSPAFKIGEKTGDPMQMYLADIFTVPVNLVGVPAISIPSGVNKDNLPLGLQLIAPWWGEQTLFEIGKSIEQ
ncbi:MAG: aspartyl/glutamyl-tRNA amidotransferase subunit A [Candidatus Lloydbacteria bacterium RIFCSPHIGHO2_01_FULL_41_20]|uniref:Glutamyl-tRNA(Gln) amidotransferase subunit A n=1 Tax=Candidatus Lloydbacteria bacterium RIFCSPHIGHO2_01_FULL_41_20 TaxID=1798657 RepID=A0A1G2CS24_9BACT|nr:MAG: aspartyl/glutamyl-tRNA amidotransferase subunit A [Candidatus Lloydbacteria bacterium RIFCSPHIGHO2_01_FULL_41_20]